MSTEEREPIVVESTAPRVIVDVWQVPVRIVHWTLFFSVIVLSVTGFYIANPFLIAGEDPQFAMGATRAIHMITAWVFIAALLARVFWAFLGNRWSRWDQFIPLSSTRRTNARESLQWYLFLRSDYPSSIGHNGLAGTTYLVLFTMFLIQIFTGFALKGLEDPGGMASDYTSWLFTIFSIQGVRFAHHLIMWLTWGFVVHHLYSAILVDYEEKNGLISSIVTGRKAIREDEL
jgi:Ni/Fe-hydrogenase 1 B-type cytochrome subunit